VVLHILQVRFGRDEATSVEISLLSLDHLGLINELVREEEDGRENPWEPSSQEILVPVVAVSWVLGELNNGEVAGTDDAEDTDDGSKNVTIWVSPGDVRKIADGATLLLPAVTETEVEQENQDPGLEDNGTNDGDEPAKDNTGTNKDGDEGKARAGSDDGKSNHGDTAGVGVTDRLVGPAVTGQ